MNRLKEYLVMGYSEKISGKKIFDILEQLKSNHTILDIHVIGTDFDGLTIILGVSGGENPCFFIDDPGRAGYEAPLSVGEKCYFEFSDESKIKYRFKTNVYSIFGKRIKFIFPEFIERSQRRKAFRIPAPSGTKLVCWHKNSKYEFDVNNVSENGLLASIKSVSHKLKFLFEGNILSKLSLSAVQEDISILINIHSAEIVRIDKIIENNRINFGLKFINIDISDQDELRRFIYYCQRTVLKRRGGL